ncbi:MAG: hypothetical protein QOE96_2371 [Blastocatellia bacterium]|nr:hypothetical protein [Blastocatellia bacterium]
MASPAATNFRQHSEEIARKFLQTIMVVDDRAFFEEKESATIPTTVRRPGPPRFNEGQELTGDVVIASTQEGDNIRPKATAVDNKGSEKASVDKAHELNAKKLIGDFAVKGIVCAVIRPKDVEVESLGDKVYPLAESCDIVVFDWVLYGATDGGKVKELISEITKRSSGKEKRLRLIVVYTGQEELADITEQIRITLEAAGQSNVIANKDYTLETGSVRIAVYAKGYVSVAAENVDLAARVVPIEELADKLIAEFTDMTMGLVSNVAIGSMAALRSNTHRILTKFPPDLDAAFLAHRAMLTQPSDAGNLLVYLIGSELTAILEGEEVSKLADEADGSDIIHAWLVMKERGGHRFGDRFPELPPANIIDDVMGLLREGVGNESLRDQLKVFKNNPHKKNLTGRLCASTVSSADLEHRFAMLTSIKSDYRVRPPALLPGTLLKRIRQVNGTPETSYWVCIQPVCDSVRLTEKRSFPLLHLKAADDKFDLVLPGEGNTYVRVRVVYSPHKSIIEDFDPSKDGLQMVRAEMVDDKYQFQTAGGERYQWLAELKFEHAQRIANEYAATISRVGLDESEWLRRSAG